VGNHQTQPAFLIDLYQKPGCPTSGASVKLHTMVLHFLIQGRVQGVGFRWYVNREASELNLRGWVRNTEEGDVEVLASGK
jgi:hypothetical protein